MSFLEHYTRVYYENLQKFTNIRETQQKPRKKFSNFSMASILDENEPENIESISPATVNPVQFTPDFWSLYSQALQYPVQKPVDIKKSENKPKRVRTIFTQVQIDRLEIEFKKSQYMIGTDRIELAKELNLSETQVIFPCNFYNHFRTIFSF